MSDSETTLGTLMQIEELPFIMFPGVVGFVVKAVVEAIKGCNVNLRMMG